MVRIDELSAGGTKALVGHIQSGVMKSMFATNLLETAAFGASGAMGMVRSGAGAAFDGAEVAERGGITGYNRHGAGQMHMSKFTRAIDRAVNNRIHVRVGCHFNDGPTTAAKVIDTRLDQITLSGLADVLIGV